MKKEKQPTAIQQLSRLLSQCAFDPGAEDYQFTTAATVATAPPHSHPHPLQALVLFSHCLFRPFKLGPWKRDREWQGDMHDMM